MSIVSSIRSMPPAELSRAFRHHQSDELATVYVGHRHLLKRSPNIFAFGEELHEAIHAHNREGWCKPCVYPYVAALREWLSERGVVDLLTEWGYDRRNCLPGGRLDALLLDGPTRRGVLEVKATTDDGMSARPEHVCQLGGYLALQSAWDGNAASAQWGLLAYALPRSGCWKLHVFHDVRNLVRPAAKLLAA